MQLADAVQRVLGGDVRYTAYDGSAAGNDAADVRIHVRSPLALSYLLQSPGELGLARAFVSGSLDVLGDMFEALRRLYSVDLGARDWGERWAILRTVGLRALRPVAPPPQEVRLRGRRHSKQRDRDAIAHHYDVSNRFYEDILGPSMAYTCAVYPRPDASLQEAQAEKFDLVCRKLALRPGLRLLDVGCGWGGMVLHAARHYGVTAIGVTLSRRQAEWGQKAIAEAGLTDRAEVRWGDYRDVAESGFDVLSSIGLTEHIGGAQLPKYFRFLHAKLRPQGRLLNHCILRRRDTEKWIHKRGFTNRYVFPDGELEGLGTIVREMQEAGFEVRHEENLREHYAKTLAAWCANLDVHWESAVAEVGAARARVWRLYLAASRLGFERNMIQLHQVLAVRSDEGVSGMPLRPTWGS